MTTRSGSSIGWVTPAGATIPPDRGRGYFSGAKFPEPREASFSVLPLLLVTLLQDTMQIRQVQVGPEETLRTVAIGTGPPVVIIPGLVGGAYSFRRVMPELAASGYHVVVIEPLGVGESARPKQADYSLTAQADRIGHALDSLALTRVLLVGHSLGASAALRLAYRRPDLVRGVLSLDGGPAETAAPPGLRRAMRWAPLLKLFVGRGTIRREVRKGLIRNSGDTTWVTPAVIDGYTEGPGRDVGATINAFRGMSRSVEPEVLHAHLPDIRVPVLLLFGTAPHETAIDTTEVTALRRGLSSFTVDSVPEAGQYLQEERPDAVTAAVRRLEAASR